MRRRTWIMTYRSNPFDKQDYSKFAFKKSELLAVLQAIDENFSFDTVASSEPIQEAIEIEKSDNQIPLHIKILAMNDYFTIVESACFISLDEPEKIQAYVDSGDFTYDAWRYAEHIQAVKIIENAIRANKLDIESDGMIPRESLQKFLFERTCVIPGFNDNLPIQEPIGCGNPTIQQTDPNIESLNAEIARLRQENEDKNKIVVELQERIKELEALQPNEQVEIQINQPESELTPEQEIPHSRQRGNVRKIIAVLVDMARLPSEPYTAFNMLDAHAQANGMELPSKDTTTKWTHNSS